MAYLNRAIADGYAFITGDEGKQWITYVSSDNHKEKYSDPETCPDLYLLFYHRLPYSFRMKDGRTLIQRIYDDHFEGYDEAEKMASKIQALPFPEPDRSVILSRMSKQLRNAKEWRDVINTFFYRLSGIEDGHGRVIFD